MVSWPRLLAAAAAAAAAACLPGAVVAAQNSSAVMPTDQLLASLAKLPECIQTCSLAELEVAGCPVAEIRSCLCTNNTMQADLAVCVQKGCNVTEQARAYQPPSNGRGGLLLASTSILTYALVVVALKTAQQDICVGIPQPSRGGEIIQSSMAIAAITFPIIALRCLSRYLVAGRIWWDDWLIILCAILLVPMAVFPVLNATKGFGKHFYNIPPENIILLRQLYYVSQIFYAIVHPTAKLSILLLYLRIFPDQRFQRITSLFLAFMVFHLVAFFFAVTFQCVPVRKIWDQTIPGKCTDLVAIIYSGAVFSIFEDLVLILLPIPQLRILNMTVRKKIALAFMFSLGSFACITSMIRLKFIVEYSSSVDLTWDDVDMTVWSIIEVFSAVICSCLMSLRPLLVKYFPRLFLTTQRSSTFNSPHNVNWKRRLSSTLTGQTQTDSRGIELLSDDEVPDPCHSSSKGISRCPSVN